MIYCSSCGTANRDGSRFCNECGSRLGTLLPCTHCGFPNLSTARFCNNCAAPVSLTPAGAATQGSPVADEEGPLESDVPQAPPDTPTAPTPPGQVGRESSGATGEWSAYATTAEEAVEIQSCEAGPAVAQENGGSALGIEVVRRELTDELLGENKAELDAWDESLTAQPEAAPVGALAVEGDAWSEAAIGEEPTPAPGRLLPAWLEEIEDYGAEGTAWDEERDGRRLRSVSKDAVGTQASGGITLAASVIAPRFDVTPRPAVRASADVDATFEWVPARPWHALSSGDSSGRPGSDRGARPGSDRKAVRGLLLLLVFVVIASAVVVAFSYAYAAWPGLPRDLGEAALAAVQQASGLISGFLK